MGADVIVATGFDEGGTLPGTALGTFSIVPLIVDAVKRVPVLAAGGITDRRTARPPTRWARRGICRLRVYQHHREPRAAIGERDDRAS